MNNTFFKIEPIFLEKIWGGNNLESMYNYKQQIENLGEVWLFSAIKEGDLLVNTGNKKIMLSQFFYENSVALGVEENYLPLIQLRLVDCNADLSLQLHPDDKLAQQAGSINGKDETWLVLKSGHDSKLIMGCDQSQAIDFKQGGSVDDLFKSAHSYRTSYHDIFHIESGLLHALGANNFVLEISQPSNTTYRVYDYKRKDVNGNERELHLDQSREAIKPELKASNIKTNTDFSNGLQTKKTIIEGRYSFEQLEITSKATINSEEKYKVIFIESSEAMTFNCQTVNNGDSFVMFANSKVEIVGNGKVVVAYE